MALMVGEKAPGFKGQALRGGDIREIYHNDAFIEVAAEDFHGRWLILFFYPYDFSFICPTELEEFGKIYQELQDLDCDVLACSTDSHFSHYAWRSQHPSLQYVPYPLIADFNGEISRRFEVLKEESGMAMRGLFIIDPNWIIKYSVIHNEDVGRNTHEILRVMKALKTGKLTPCNWNEGDETLD